MAGADFPERGEIREPDVSIFYNKVHFRLEFASSSERIYVEVKLQKDNKMLL